MVNGMWLIDIIRRLRGGGKTSGKPEEPVVLPADEEVTPGEEGKDTTPREEQKNAAGLLAVTCIGYSHIKHDTVCQDSSLFHEGDGFRFIAVSDGHGSSSFPRSDRGSRLACRSALDVCAELVGAGIPEDREQAAKDLCEDIVARWTTAVLADYAADPFDEACLEGVSEKYREHYRNGRHVEHAYGATLIGALEIGGRVLAIRCGDGECVAIDRQGSFSTPIPWNDKCDVNVTTSLCDKDAAGEFRWVWLDEVPAALWIGTDGVDNSYPVPEELREFYANLSVGLLEQGRECVLAELEKFLPVLTRQCSQDDLSVAAMWDPEGLKSARETLASYLELCRLLRDRGELQRRLKLTARVLREKEKELNRAEEGAKDAICREMDVFRQEEKELEAKLAEQEARVLYLKGRLDSPAE